MMIQRAKPSRRYRDDRPLGTKVPRLIRGSPSSAISSAAIDPLAGHPCAIPSSRGRASAIVAFRTTCLAPLSSARAPIAAPPHLR
jgi:hypothetical protein